MFANFCHRQRFRCRPAGKGITVQPIQSTISEESFQTLLVVPGAGKVAGVP